VTPHIGGGQQSLSQKTGHSQVGPETTMDQGYLELINRIQQDTKKLGLQTVKGEGGSSYAE